MKKKNNNIWTYFVYFELSNFSKFDINQEILWLKLLLSNLFQKIFRPGKKKEAKIISFVLF